MAKYRKKPIVIDAIKYHYNSNKDNNYGEIRQFVYLDNKIIFGIEDNGCLTIHTLEGDHLANPGDWIIKGVVGEFYPCKSDIFEQTYDKVEE